MKTEPTKFTLESGDRLASGRALNWQLWGVYKTFAEAKDAADPNRLWRIVRHQVIWQNTEKKNG